MSLRVMLGVLGYSLSAILGCPQSRTQSNACTRARMALALGKLNFSCAVIGLNVHHSFPAKWQHFI
jgi:hypothetical protein